MGGLLLLGLLGWSGAVEVRFEDPAAGFFLAREAEGPGAGVLGPEGLGAGLLGPEPAPAPGPRADARAFTLLAAGPATLRASLGPFLARQTVTPLGGLRSNVSLGPGAPSLGPGARAFDLSAHLVTREVRKDSPVLRVLFHTGQRGPTTKKKGTVCILLTAALGNRSVSTACAPGGRDGSCLGQLTLPAAWWPGLASAAHQAGTKQPKIVALVSYRVTVGRRGECGGTSPAGSLAVGGEHAVGGVPLEGSRAGYQQVAGDETLHLLIPQAPLYPGSRLYVPVFLEQPRAGPPVAVLAVKCRARRGVRIAGVEEASADWTLRVEVNSRGSTGTVTAFRRDAALLDSSRREGPQEIFNWLYVVEEAEEEVWEGGKLSWQVKYQAAEQAAGGEGKAGEEAAGNMTGPPAQARLRHRLEVRKDDVQTVVPISKSWALMNTAILTGRQVSQPMKIFIVSEAGKIADVTLHTSCTSADDSALKVSSSCTSVYVDGSESRGALSALVKVQYGTFSGEASFVVWVPEQPLTVRLPDSKLSPVKAWRVPASSDRGYQKRAAEKQDSWRSQLEQQAKEDEVKTKLLEDKLTALEKGEKCRERFQQTEVTVLARFLAEDPESGRRDYYLSRAALLEVTDLVRGHLRSSDPRVARLEGPHLRGAAPGRAEVQVVSPLTGRVLGSAEVRVVKQRESVRGLRVRVVSGLSLAVRPGEEAGARLLHTILTERLTSKYQEGMLDITVEFTDGTSTPLLAIDPAHYYLTVDSLAPHVIAFAPVSGSADPRVVAVGRGRGDLLQLSLELADDCHQKDDAPLATGRAAVTVDFLPEEAGEERSVTKSQKAAGKAGGMEGGMKSVDMGDLSEILSNIALRDDNSQSRHFDSADMPSNVYGQHRDFHPHTMTPLEVGMYILLGVFCIAIAIFMASCFVYASKHQHQPPFPLQHKSQSVQNAHDWVWLGRQTLDKSSVQSSSSRDVLDNTANSIRSRESSRTYQARTTPGLPFRFEASADVNIFPNPVSDYGFGAGRELYAELPRRRPGPRARGDTGSEAGQLYQPLPGQQLYQNSAAASPRLSSRSPFLERRREASPSPQCSPLPSRASSHRAPSSLVNSATYTRPRPVVPSQDILPVGFPLCHFEAEEAAPGPAGFQNPWEALQLGGRPDVEEGGDRGLTLELGQDPPPGYAGLRQSPASALPPCPGLIITPEHILLPRGEYIPLNPDINKPSPPRLGARKVFADPFNVAESEAPAVRADQLSPSHVFSSLEELRAEVAAGGTNGESEEEEEGSATDLSGQEDNCSSVCSADSEELEPGSPGARPAAATLDSVALGSLDYDQLMGYFESLKESSA